MMEPWEVASHYHRATEHHYDRSARSLGYMDWSNQPNPFRCYRGATSYPLELVDDDEGPAYDSLFDPVAITPQGVSGRSLSLFMRYSLAISAWKEFGGSRWALRINPSSGNLHPTEGYLVTGPIENLYSAPGVFHYAPEDHALERRAEYSLDQWSQLIGSSAAESFLVGLSSIHWRESWKYGERAYRYCQHDIGHAIAAITMSAAMLGWRLKVLGDLADADVAALLGLNRAQDYHGAEREQPAVIVVVICGEDREREFDAEHLTTATIQENSLGAKWTGNANRLSENHVDWEIIEQVADACTKPRTSNTCASRTTSESDASRLAVVARPVRPLLPARSIISRRRSAVALDGKSAIDVRQFLAILERTMPHADRVPCNALGPPSFVDLGLLVHRVNGLQPGIYYLLRTSEGIGDSRESMREGFAWQRPECVPDSLPLYLLATGDYREISGQVSCGQDIASDGAFSCAMIARFDDTLQAHGAWLYRRLHWETGVIGQVLYLEAEAAGIRGTGIGCFFDQAVGDLFQLRGSPYRSLYHFTMGQPIEDTRLTTLSAYSPERGDQ